MVIRILVADDHDVVRTGLRTLLELDPDLSVVGEAADGLQATELAVELKPDLVLMDLIMPVMDGAAATRRIRQHLPHTEIVALTSVLEGTLGTAAVEAGAIGFLLKDGQAENLVESVKAAAAGQVQLGAKFAARLVQDAPPYEHVPIESQDESLLTMIAQGCSNARMAQERGVDEAALRSEIDGLLRKIGAGSKAQAAVIAVQRGLTTLAEVGRGPQQTTVR